MCETSLVVRIKGKNFYKPPKLAMGRDRVANKWCDRSKIHFKMYILNESTAQLWHFVRAVYKSFTNIRLSLACFREQVGHFMESFAFNFHALVEKLTCRNGNKCQRLWRRYSQSGSLKWELFMRGFWLLRSFFPIESLPGIHPSITKSSNVSLDPISKIPTRRTAKEGNWTAVLCFHKVQAKSGKKHSDGFLFQFLKNSSHHKALPVEFAGETSFFLGGGGRS